MDELEQRLRSALTEMAEEVPPSHGAWEEQQRRLALKSRRTRLRPALMAAVAAAVALIAVPVVIIGARVDRGTEAGSPPPMTAPDVTNPPSTGPALPGRDKAVRYSPREGELVLAEPVAVASQPTSDGYETTYAYAVRRASWKQEFCLSSVPKGATTIDEKRTDQPSQGCFPLTPPKPGKVIWGQYPVPRTAPNYGTYVYVTSSPAENMIVLTDGQYTVGHVTTAGPEFSLIRVEVFSANAPQKYTARDVNNKNLENGP